MPACISVSYVCTVPSEVRIHGTSMTDGSEPPGRVLEKLIPGLLEEQSKPLSLLSSPKISYKSENVLECLPIMYKALSSILSTRKGGPFRSCVCTHMQTFVLPSLPKQAGMIYTYFQCVI